MSFTVVNPANNKQGKSWELFSREKVDGIIENAHQQFHTHKNSDFARRAAYMNKAAALLRERKERYAELMANEMGKPISQGRGEIDKCAWVCEYYAENAESFLEPRNIETAASESFVTYNPLGLILAIMPWNFPFWQVFRFAAPALMAGNSCLLKHAPNVPGCAVEIEKLLNEAGLPEYLFTNLIISTREVSRILESPLIKAATLTGSEAAGSAVAEKAGRHLKKTVLELGGSDPYLILEDADVEKAAETCVASRLLNTGQSCISAKRFIVSTSIHDEFLDKVIEWMQTYRAGDPGLQETHLGPLARQDLRDKLHNQVTESVKMGARSHMGGYIPEEPGAWYPPTILSNVKEGMPAFDQETFGPAAAVIKAESEQEAIHLANNSHYGLGAAVFTGNVERARHIASRELEAGSCFINDFVKSDPRLPFGGIKNSGYGRELSDFGIREFVNIKTVSMA